MHTPPRSDWKAFAQETFEAAPFVRFVGYRLVGLEPGICRSALDLRPEHFQQNGVVHAGVQATLLDHTAGTAAATLAPEGRFILTVEFKTNLLRGALGPRLACRAEIVKPGRTIVLAEARLYDVSDGGEALASTATVTLMNVAGRG